jgi:HEAT repeat protein
MRATHWFVAVIWSAAVLPRAAGQFPDHTGQVPQAEPLGALISHSSAIAVLQVVKVDGDAGIITFKKVADLKGKHPEDELRHSLLGSEDRAALCEWARPGRTAVFFAFGHQAVTCLGNHWNYNWDYGERGGVWSTASWVNDFERTYVGSVENLRDAAAAILDGKEVVIAAAEPERVRPFDEQTPIVRDWLQGKKGRVRRIKASLKLIDDKAITECPGGYSVGWGVGGKEAVPALIAALKHDEARVRSEAAEDLGQLGPEAKPAVPALRKALDDEEGFVRVFAAEALGPIDPDNKRTLPALLQAAASKQAGVRAAAVAALVAIGPPARRAVPQLVVLLREDGDAYTRAVSAFALGRLAPESDDPDRPRREVVAALVKALRQDRDKSVRKWAVAALLKFGPDAKPALADLRAALKDKSIEVAAEATNVLARLGPDGSAALVAALGEKECQVRGLVTDRLGDLGPHSKDLMPALLKALESDDAGVRLGVAKALLRIDPDTGARVGVPVMARLAADKDYEYRKCVIEDLGEIGAPARAAVPALIDVLKAKGKHRRVAADALGAIGPEARSAVPALIEALDSDKFGVYASAVLALGRIGSDAKPALPALRAKLKAANGATERVRLATALARIGDKQEAASVLLELGLNAKDWLAREWALQALGEMGPAAAPVLPALKKAMRNEDDWERRWVAFAVWRIGRRVESGGTALDERLEAVEALTALIRTPDRKFGLYGVTEVVELLGRDAASLAPAFVAVLKDKSRSDRGAALRALDAMGPAAAEAVLTLEAKLKEDPEQVEVAVALARLGRPDLAVRALPTLIKQAEAEWESSRIDYYRTLDDLKTLGREAKPAVPVLLRLMRHDHPSVYAHAASALLAIDPEAAARAGVRDAPRASWGHQTGVGPIDDD